MNVKNIGLLGGTFDPVHYGHLQLAASALEECGLDKIVFIPSAQPPHKNDASITSFKHRWAMLTLAVEGIDGFECNAIEDTMSKPSYTIDTLQALRKHYGSNYQLYFLIGTDAFLDILTWKSHQEILQLVNIILSRRQGYKGAQLSDLLRQLGYKESDRNWYREDGKKGIYILEKMPEDLSSSGIRSRIEKGASVQRFLPQSVIEYIRKNKLYQSEKAGKKSCAPHVCRDKC